MKMGLLAPITLAAIAVLSVPDHADPWKDESGHGRGGYKVEEKYDPRTGAYKYEEKGPGYKYEYKEDGHGRRVMEYRGRGGPPPWAPAHGRRGRAHARGDAAYVPPFDIDVGRCNRALLGAAIGGAAGGLLGSKVGKGDGQLAATAAGTVIGVLVGGSIGRSMDRLDQSCVGQILEHSPDGRGIIWSDGANGPRYEVAPTRTYQAPGGAYCREYQTTATVGGERQRMYGTACREPDGAWRLVS